MITSFIKFADRLRDHGSSAVLLALFAVAGLVANPAQAMSLTDEERGWLDTHCDDLLTGSVVGYRPYAFRNTDGRLGGLAGDYMALLEERLGCRFQLREYSSFAGLLEAARQREVDLVPFAVAAPERKSYLAFTQPFYTISDRILTRVDNAETLGLDDLDGRRVGIIEGYVLQAELEANRPGIELVPYANERDAIRGLSFGAIDVLLADSGAVLSYMREEGITNIRVAGDTGIQDYQAIGVRSDWPILRDILDKALADISAEERTSIERRWVNLSGVDPIELERLWRRIATTAVAAIFIAVVVFLWIVSLRRLVARRTLQLQQELSERRRVEATNERLVLAVEQAAAYVLIVDSDGKVEYANLAFIRASGRSDVIGLPLESLAGEPSRQTLQRVLEDLSQGGSWRGRVYLTRADEEDMRVAMIISPIDGGSDSTGGYVVSGRDVTLEEQLEARVRQGERLSALGTLAGGIAHDFNNLLVPILGYVDLVRRESSSAAGEYLDAISKAGERARQLVQRILTFSTQHEGARDPLDLRHEVNEGITFLRSLLPATMEIRAELEDCKPVVGDQTQIQQILMNLGTNASDAMGAGGGVLEIKLAMIELDENLAAAQPDLEPGEYCLLTVRDNGEGMDVQKQARIFDPYFTDKPQGKGSGLGLATVHGIVTAHGGAISVESSPGWGTTFSIYFPCDETAQPVLVESDESMPTPASGENVLVVDDDILVLDVVAAMLEGIGYSVTRSSDPLEALEMVRARPNTFDAILTDFTMPGLTGTQLAQRIWESRPGIPIVLMSGLNEMVESEGLPSIGKPIRIRDLADRMHKAMA